VPDIPDRNGGVRIRDGAITTNKWD
jgi:hypothetical protein